MAKQARKRVKRRNPSAKKAAHSPFSVDILLHGMRLAYKNNNLSQKLQDAVPCKITVHGRENWEDAFRSSTTNVEAAFKLLLGSNSATMLDVFRLCADIEGVSFELYALRELIKAGCKLATINGKPAGPREVQEILTKWNIVNGEILLLPPKQKPRVRP
jgi:hypothetical protein